MKFYWDTSAAINAAVSPVVNARLAQGEHFARLHLFSEFFSIMIKRGILARDAQQNPVRVILDPDDAAQWLRDFSSKVTLTELNSEEILQGLARAKALNVTGPRVYDYGHALAAAKVGADLVLTRNEKDFQGLTGTARIEWP